MKLHYVEKHTPTLIIATSFYFKFDVEVIHSKCETQSPSVGEQFVKLIDKTLSQVYL